MKRNMTQWVDGLLASPERKALPVVTYPGADLTGAKIMDLISKGQVQFECIQALCQKFPSAAAITIMDLSAEAETFGSPVKFSDHEAPTVTAPIVLGMEGIRALPRARPGLKRTMAYLEAARLCVRHITDRPTFGGVIGPFSLAGRLFDVTQLMVEMRRHPKMVHMLLAKCTEYILEYIRAFKTVGAHGVVMAEPTAGLLSPAMSKTFAYNYIRYMVDQVQDENFIVVLHNCGPATKQVPGMLGTNSRVLHFGNAVDMLDILPQVPPHVLACGNIDPSNVMRMGTPQLVREKVSELLFRTYAHRNFLLSTGCDVPAGTPLRNLEEFYATLADYNRTRGHV